MGCGIFFNACSCTPGPATKIMNIALNPEIEFVLDKKNKVVSANALNEEGNFIISKVDFAGLKAKDATKEFLDASKEYGYLVKDSTVAGDNELKISISGELAEIIFNDVKVAADKHINWIKVSATVKFDGVIEREDIEAKVLECMQEYTQSDLADKTDAELIGMIEESRQETKNILSQEAKKLYYRTRANEILKQRYTKIKDLINANDVIADDKKAEYTEKLDTLVEKISEVKTKYEDTFVKANSDYQKALKKFLTLKKGYLQARLNNLDATTQAVIAGNLTTEYGILNAAKDVADASVILVDGAVSVALGAIELWLNTTSVTNLLDSDVVEQSASNARASYAQTFASSYANYTQENYWNNYWSVLNSK